MCYVARAKEVLEMAFAINARDANARDAAIGELGCPAGVFLLVSQKANIRVGT